MATANPQGIMALPAGGAPAETRAPAQPQLGLDDSYDAVQQGLQNASPDASSVVNAELAKIVPQLDQLPDDILDQLLQVIQFLHDNPDKYAQAVKELVDEGIIDEGDFPEEYDPEFLATFGMVIMQARKSRRGAQGAAPVTPPLMPPVGMARGGIAEAVNMVASQGRGQDTMLAHINPREAQMLRSMGGVGTLNPVTGLPEYNIFKKIGNAFKSVGNAVKNVVKGVGTAVKQIVSSPVGRMIATVALAAFIGPAAFGLSGAAGAAASMAIASGTVTAIGGGSMEDVLKSAAIAGATAFFGAPGGPVSNFVGQSGITNAAANAAVSSGIVGTGIGLLSGQKLEDAVKSGITAGAVSGLTTGASKGFDAQIEMPKAPTVGEMLDQNRPTAQQPEGATSKAVRGLYADGEVQGSPLSPADAAGTEGLTPVMDPATKDILTVAADNKVYRVFNRPDGSPVFQPVRGSSANAPEFMRGSVIPSDSQVIARMGSSEIFNPPDMRGPLDINPYAKLSSDYRGSAAGTVDMSGPDPNAYLSSDYRSSAGGGAAPVTSSASAAAGTGDSPVTGPYKPQTVMGSLKKIGGGASDMAQGDFSKGFDGLSEGAGDLFFPEGPPPTQVRGSEVFKSAIADGADYNTAYQEASAAMGAPGIIRTYGPATVAGLGIAGLAGAFTPKKPEPSPEEEAMNARLQAERDRVAANPGAYVPQGLERFGIQYNDRGEIIGSQPFNPQPLGPTEVAGNYMPYTPSPYMIPSGGIGNPFTARPYNTSSMYDFMPRYAATGGIMSAMPSSNSSKRNAGGIASLARGGYPRRTGQISGPGTGTSDSIPAMLSDGEFVMTAKAVRGAGKGNRLAGAKKMYALMHQLERNAARG
jgi:hypothetical protein